VGAATLLSASLKFDGTLIIQAQSKGPIQLLVVECKSDLSSMRATVKLSVEKPLIKVLWALQDHQGAVIKPVSSAAEAIALYMQNSEQLDTRIWFASSDTQVGGLLLQRLPNSGGHAHLDLQIAAEGWSRIQTLGETIDYFETSLFFGRVC
jgi:molecular chaperone Hsp33